METEDSQPRSNTDGHDKPSKVKQVRRLIGIRHLFPSLDSFATSDKCRIWVKRHKNKYFVDWADEQLQAVDAVIRPFSVITPELYKIHMNRNEFNRMKYLQFCLESDESWATEFREKLQKPQENGGFAGLNQAKVVATELWRQHSADYRNCLSNGAKHVSPTISDDLATKRRKLESPVTTQCENGEGLHGKFQQTVFPGCVSPHVKEEYDSDNTCGAIDLRRSSGERSDHSSDAEQSTGKASIKSECTSKGKHVVDRKEGSQLASSKNPNDNSIKQLDKFVSNILGPDEVKSGPSNFHQLAFSPFASHVFPYGASMVPYPNHAMSMVPYGRMAPSDNPASPDQQSVPSPPLSYESGDNQTIPSKSSSSRRRNGSPWKWAPKSWRGKHGDQQEWKKSERGMSFLFQSISDQPLTLWEKVNLIVTRHKNNYFLDWTEKQLSELDPLVRPKVLVTKERYKEYCHRNAMKYDSNLQFAMEAHTHWAEKFRERLKLEPEQGGFSNMCHVRSEAGRLWREHSGKYRHRNVVKENMDLNDSRGGSDHEGPNSNVSHVTKVADRQSSRRSKLKSSSNTFENKNINHCEDSASSSFKNCEPHVNGGHDDSATSSPKLKQSSKLSKVIDRLAVMKSANSHELQQNNAHSPSSEDLSGSNKIEAIDWLWSCRDMLQNACREDPAASWHGRLRPYLHIFKKRLGHDYQLPGTVSGCVADLVLVLLDSEIQSSGMA